MSPGRGNKPADLVVFNAGNNRRIDFRELTTRQFEDFWLVGCLGGVPVGRCHFPYLMRLKSQENCGLAFS